MTTATSQPVPTAQSAAESLLQWAIGAFGTEMVSLAIDAVANPAAAATQLMDDLDNLLGGVLNIVLNIIEPEAAKALVKAAYAAAETAGDAAEAARLATTDKG